MATLQLIASLDGIDGDIATIGGKAASLGLLRGFGAPVPPAVALTTEAYRLHARQIGIPERASAVSSSDVPAIRSAILDTDVPAEIREAIENGVARIANGVGTLAVRSSATTEDSPEFSFAGLHDTSLAVPADAAAVEHAVKTCWASLWSERSVDYRRRGGESLNGAAMGVIIQQLVQSDVAFVAFSANPIDYCSSQVIISASYGLGEAVVAGLVVPDHIVLGRDGGVESYQIGSKETMVIPESIGGGGVRIVPVPRLLANQPALTNDQAIQIGKIVCQLEKQFGTPLDIEGGITAGTTWLFQARPITTCVKRI
jgi:pyruvate,water dikinase